MRVGVNDGKFWRKLWLPFKVPVTPAPEIQPIVGAIVVPRQSAAALPRNLKRLREAKGWTVGQLSKASGVNRSTIRNVLDIDKAHNHTLEVILRLAQALGVGIQDLLEERP